MMVWPVPQSAFTTLLGNRPFSSAVHIGEEMNLMVRRIDASGPGNMRNRKQLPDHYPELFPGRRLARMAVIRRRHAVGTTRMLTD
jgi:hypothetical protein